jgi:hypothetical protein
MEATVVDLRYRMNDVLKALDRNESVRVFYHGKIKGVLASVSSASGVPVRKHPFFGMRQDAACVDAVMDGLRGGRHRGL